MKQSTLPDAPTSGSDIFAGTRPTLVVDEGATEGSFAKEVIAESATSDKTSVVEVSTDAEFVNQFVSQCNPRAFPWALKCD